MSIESRAPGHTSRFTGLESMVELPVSKTGLLRAVVWPNGAGAVSWRPQVAFCSEPHETTRAVVTHPPVGGNHSSGRPLWRCALGEWGLALCRPQTIRLARSTRCYPAGFDEVPRVRSGDAPVTRPGRSAPSGEDSVWQGDGVVPLPARH